ncbi:hypothetical protein PLICRDRAFT_56762 [Plicaturopsis crispa FD-325 SS-3]|nr:hypothetical protein PLICRDRAFT_56762 [Plicaturopsis crispa FD-325 SS-3]
MDANILMPCPDFLCKTVRPRCSGLAAINAQTPLPHTRTYPLLSGESYCVLPPSEMARRYRRPPPRVRVPPVAEYVYLILGAICGWWLPTCFWAVESPREMEQGLICAE